MNQSVRVLVAICLVTKMIAIASEDNSSSLTNNGLDVGEEYDDDGNEADHGENNGENDSSDPGLGEDMHIELTLPPEKTKYRAPIDTYILLPNSVVKEIDCKIYNRSYLASQLAIYKLTEYGVCLEG